MEEPKCIAVLPLFRRPTIHELAREYYEAGATQAELAATYGVQTRTIGKWLQNGRVPRRYGEDGHMATDCPGSDVLEELYDDMTTTEVAEEIGASQPSVSKWLRAHDIKTRLSGQSADVSR